MSDFIPFHRELTRGDKRGLSRATRFIYLELVQEARATGGVLRLPSARSTAVAIHDLIGGDQREIRTALEQLSEPLRTGDDPMIRVVEYDNGAARDVVIVAWDSWKLKDTNALRQRRYRERNKARALDGDNALRYASRDESVTSNSPEERRGEERKGDARNASRPDPFSPGERHDAAETYQDCACRIMGSWSFSNRGERETVAGVVEAHAPKDLSAIDRRKWLSDAIGDWVKKDETARPSGLKPMKFSDWLRAQRPVKRADGNTLPPAKKNPAHQPFEGHK